MSNFASSKSVILKNVRLDWFDLYRTAKDQAGRDTGKYKVKGIIEPGSEAETAAKKAMSEAAVALWGANAANVVANIPANNKGLRPGNSQIATDGSIKAEYRDKIIISASNRSKPTIVGPAKHNGKFVQILEDGSAMIDGQLVVPPYKITPLYRGCYVNLKVQFVAGKATKGSNGETIPNQVYAKIEAVQFVRDGEAFGTGPTSADGFDDEATESNGAGEADLF